jgi:hypothetical protein
MEYEAGYVDVAVKRWQKMTKLEATLESDGRTFEEIAASRAAGSRSGSERRDPVSPGTRPGKHESTAARKINSSGGAKHDLSGGRHGRA